MKTLFSKRNLIKLSIWWKSKMYPSDFEPITKTERESMLVFNALVKHPTSELLIHPSHEKYYIKSAKTGIFITLTPSRSMGTTEISIINHIYGYNVRLGERASNVLTKTFLMEVDKRRLQMETDYNNNIQHSLHHISKTIKKRL
jgi:hypothetical protein